MFVNPPDAAIRACLERAKTIAVVGLSPRPDRPSHRIARRLQQWGYRIIPVRPAVTEVLGEKAYARLSEVPDRIDLVDIFRAAKQIGPIVEHCIALRMPALWIQQGIVNEAAAARARDAGLFVVMDRCIAVEYRRLMPAVPA
ncbi:MAG: CoA-binding protein [bacterium]